MRNQLSGKGLQRAQLAHLTGCHLETIRYYEKIGLLRDPPRSASGYRLYDETDIRRLRFILRARELGFGIDEIRGLLHLVDCQSQTCAEVDLRRGRPAPRQTCAEADLRRGRPAPRQTRARANPWPHPLPGAPARRVFQR